MYCTLLQTGEEGREHFSCVKGWPLISIRRDCTVDLEIRLNWVNTIDANGSGTEECLMVIKPLQAGQAHGRPLLLETVDLTEERASGLAQQFLCALVRNSFPFMSLAVVVVVVLVVVDDT